MVVSRSSHLDSNDLWQLRQRLRTRGAGGKAAQELGHALYAEGSYVHRKRLNNCHPRATASQQPQH